MIFIKANKNNFLEGESLTLKAIIKYKQNSSIVAIKQK